MISSCSFGSDVTWTTSEMLTHREVEIPKLISGGKWHKGSKRWHHQAGWCMPSTHVCQPLLPWPRPRSQT